MMDHFSNDNTSPEIFSFYPVRRISADSVGKELAKVINTASSPKWVV